MSVNLMQMDFDCPICKAKFKAPRVRRAKLILIGMDNDLREYHEGIDAVLYDVISCHHCGFTSTNEGFANFEEIYVERTKLGIKELEIQKIQLNQVLPDDAITRYINAINLLNYKKAKNSEYYFLYSRLAWVYRTIPSVEALENEYLSLKKAFEYLEKAYKLEPTPFLGIDESTIIFTLGEIARRIGEYEKANLYIGKSILDPKSTDELRDRAKTTKDLIANDIEQVQKIIIEAQLAEKNNVNDKSKKKKKKK